MLNCGLGSKPCVWVHVRTELTGVSVFGRNVVSCCRLKAKVVAVTRWTATSCARAAAPDASRTSQPKSPLTANKPTLFPAPTSVMGNHEPINGPHHGYKSFMPLLFWTFFLLSLVSLPLNLHIHSFSSPCWLVAAISFETETFLLMWLLEWEFELRWSSHVTAILLLPISFCMLLFFWWTSGLVFVWQ